MESVQYLPNDVICNCKRVTLADIDNALHQHTVFSDVEQEFKAIQEQTACSTGCGGCHDKIMGIISQMISG